MALSSRWLAPDSQRRRLALSLGIYLVTTAAFAAVAGPARLLEHTPYNHYAHLADAWLHGRQDLAHGPPAYAMGNDFAHFEGHTYISFPPFPAVLMLPWVALAGTPEDFRDGLFFVMLAGAGPAVLLLVLEKLRRAGLSTRSEAANAVLSLLFAFGTVYFFTAVQGTVWFAAHVVGVAAGALYVLFSLDASQPALAGLMLACAWTTRPSMLLMFPLFALEAVRASCAGALPGSGTARERVVATWRRLDATALVRAHFVFAAPLALSFALAAWSNYTRFHTPSPFAFGHEHLGVVWHARMHKWGLFGYHYLSKNLGVLLTILPWVPPRGVVAGAPFQINEHGLALWFVTPVYLWVLWPRRRGWMHDVVALSALLPTALDLLYQNSGWRQFSYRFSNDYALLLFVLLALGERRFGVGFRVAVVWSVACNLFGAVTFDRAAFDGFYFREGSQSVLYQPD